MGDKPWDDPIFKKKKKKVDPGTSNVEEEEKPKRNVSRSIQDDIDEQVEGHTKLKKALATASYPWRTTLFGKKGEAKAEDQLEGLVGKKKKKKD
jgi:hypothetical protein